MKTIAVLLAALCTAAAYAEGAYPPSAAPSTQATSEPLSEGEVRRVDRDAGKITIKHGPLANLDMPAMTMVFQVRDPALLENVQAGDTVKFRAEKEGATYLVTAIER